MSPPRWCHFHLFLVLICVGRIWCDDPSPDLSQEQEKPKPVFVTPALPESPYLVLFFESSSDLQKSLVLSEAKKDGGDESISKYDGLWTVEVPHSSAIDNDFALILKSRAKHHAVSSKLSKPIKFDTNEVVIQYEVKFQDDMECGGAYIKLLSSPVGDLKEFNDKTPYTIMFGPDKCGLDHKFHFILRHKNPITGKFEEKHAKKVKAEIERYFSDKKTHLYTLVLKSDNTFERYIDQVKVQSGSFFEDFEPPINPPKELDDPAWKKPEEKIVDTTATKPDDWDESAPEFITDEKATKPDGWLDDEPDMIPDPNTEQPKDWDMEMDGDWEAPKIKNPKCVNAPGCGEWRKPIIRNPNYKGKWSAPLIDNPAFKTWKPKKIPNPDYFEDTDPYRNLNEVNAIGLELWSMTSNVAFDNFLIVDSKRAADAFAKETWVLKEAAERKADVRAQSVVDAIKETYSEKPWLIFVIGLVCTLPILLCCIFICRSPRDTTALRKKKDISTPDEVNVKESGITNTGAGDDGDAEVADEEEEDDEAALDVANESDEESPVEKDLAASDETLENDDEVVPVQPDEVAQAEKQAVRKRRSRKD